MGHSHPPFSLCHQPFWTLQGGLHIVNTWPLSFFSNRLMTRNASLLFCVNMSFPLRFLLLIVTTVKVKVARCRVAS